MTSSARRTCREALELSFDDRRQFTRDGRPKERPGPKPGPLASMRVRHRLRAPHERWAPVHVRLRAKPGLPSFRTATLYPAFEDAVRRTRRDDFRIVEYSVQDDHLHLIVEADDDGALHRGMKSFSVRANRLYNAAHGRGRGPVWTDRYDRVDLTGIRQVRDALVYCLTNVERHERATSGESRNDPCSSARWFTDDDDESRPNERARTALLVNASRSP